MSDVDSKANQIAASYTFLSRFLDSASVNAGIEPGELGRRVKSTFHGFCKLIEPEISLEIGAFEAGFSRRVKSMNPSCRAIAFEANPFVYERFREEVVAAGVEYLNCCVAHTSGKITLNVPTDYRNSPRGLDNQMASLHKNLNTRNHQEVEIDAVRIDDIFDAEVPSKLVAWIDVEGACEQVLRGSQKVLEKAAAVYIEVESSPIWDGQWLDHDVAKFFIDLGFVMVMKDKQRPQQFNLVFVNQEIAMMPQIARRAARVLQPSEAVVTADIGSSG